MFHFKTVVLPLFFPEWCKRKHRHIISPPLCFARNASLSPNVVHHPPLRHPRIQRRWQVAKLNWRQNFPKYIVTPQAWQGEPSVLFKCSFVLRKMMANKLKDLWFSLCLLFFFFHLKVHKHENKSNQNSRTLRIYIFPPRDVQDGGNTWTLHSQFSTVTARATAWLIIVHAGKWVTSTLPWGIPSVDSGARLHTQKIKNRLMDRWKNTGLQMAYFIKEMAKRLSNPITPPARSHAGLFRFVTDAITIHTCSSQEKHQLSFPLSLQATGRQSKTFDCEIAKLKWRNKTWLKKRVMISSGFIFIMFFFFPSHIKGAQIEQRMFFSVPIVPLVWFEKKKRVI